MPVSYLYLLYTCFFLPCYYLSFILFVHYICHTLFVSLFFFSELQLDPSADQRRKTAKDWKPKYSRDLQQRAKSSSGGSGGNRKWPLFRPKKATNGLDQIKLADSSSAYSEVIFICREFEIREGKMRFQSFSRQKSSALSHIKYLRLRRALHHSPFFYINPEMLNDGSIRIPWDHSQFLFESENLFSWIGIATDWKHPVRCINDSAFLRNIVTCDFYKLLPI